MEDKTDYPKLRIKYKKFMILTKILDNKLVNKREKLIERDKVNTNINYNKYKENYINNKYKNNRIVDIFKNLEVILNKRSKISKIKNYKIHNIIEDHNNCINNRKVNNNLLRPHYFFPAGYNEGPKPSQIRQ